MSGSDDGQNEGKIVVFYCSMCASVCCVLSGIFVWIAESKLANSDVLWLVIFGTFVFAIHMGASYYIIKQSFATACGCVPENLNRRIHLLLVLAIPLLFYTILFIVAAAANNLAFSWLWLSLQLVWLVCIVLVFAIKCPRPPIQLYRRI